MFFLGALLLLMGSFGFIRILHIKARSVPYPSAGVLPSNIIFSGPFSSSFGRESDCTPYPTIYYEADNTTPREATEEERLQEEKLAARCVEGFNEDRAKMKQYDKNLSAFLIFVGAGLIFSRRFID